MLYVLYSSSPMRSISGDVSVVYAFLDFSSCLGNFISTNVTVPMKRALNAGTRESLFIVESDKAFF